jgi:hypothetical protein
VGIIIAWFAAVIRNIDIDFATVARRVVVQTRETTVYQVT